MKKGTRVRVVNLDSNKHRIFRNTYHTLHILTKRAGKELKDLEGVTLSDPRPLEHLSLTDTVEICYVQFPYCSVETIVTTIPVENLVSVEAVVVPEENHDGMVYNPYSDRWSFL